MEEVPAGPRPIQAVGTSTAGFVGVAPAEGTVRLRSFAGNESIFAPDAELGHAVQQFFASGGSDAWITDALSGLDAVEDLGLLCLPGESDVDVLREALAYAERRRAFLIVDPPGLEARAAMALASALGGTGTGTVDAALYYPPVQVDVGGTLRTVAPSGAVAGMYARTDAARGVWKAPAGDEAVLPGVAALAVAVDRAQADELAAAGVNAIRSFPTRGIRVWGARTIAQGGSEWKYVSVRRTFLFLERSIERGIEWAVFEPNDEPLWAKLRAQVGAFLHGLFKAGAFQGSTADKAYFVKCGRDTMTQGDLDSGHLNVMIGIAPVRPAEFVILSIGKQLGREASDVLESTGKPSQRLPLMHRPVGPEGVFLQVEGDSGWTTWTQVESFDGAGPGDAAYVLDRQAGELIFGDGEHGAVPPSGASVQATYTYGAAAA